jgi:hypothetical protein
MEKENLGEADKQWAFKQEAGVHSSKVHLPTFLKTGWAYFFFPS